MYIDEITKGNISGPRVKFAADLVRPTGLFVDYHCMHIFADAALYLSCFTAVTFQCDICENFKSAIGKSSSKEERKSLHEKKRAAPGNPEVISMITLNLNQPWLQKNLYAATTKLGSL